MPRNELGVFTSANPPVVTNTTISSPEYNSTIADIVADANAIRPLVAGGTGGSNAETAQTALGVAPKQSSTYDRTAGRGLIVGAFGLGGNAGEWTLADGLLSDIVPTSTRKIIAASALAQGAPAAVDGLCHTSRWDGSNATQVYEPTSGTTTWPWRRRQAAGAWSAWIRDFDQGNETTGRWRRTADGWQTCLIGPVKFVYVGTDRLGYTWTFPKPFVATPVISYVTSTTTDDFVGLSPDSICGFARSTGTTSSDCRLWRVRGAPNFGASDTVSNVALMATGRWLDL